MFKFLGIVVVKESEFRNIKAESWKSGFEEGHFQVSPFKDTPQRISPRTGLPVRKYTKRK